MLWRLHLNTEPTNGKTRGDVVRYCIENNIAGIGWPVGSFPKNLEEYKQLAISEYNGRSVPSIRFAFAPQQGEIMWARDKEGIYYLGVISSDWFYSNNIEHLELDIPNQRKCFWVKVGNEENVPGKIVSCFRPRRAFQAIEDEQGKLTNFSKWLFNQKITDKSKKFQNILTPDIKENAELFFQFIGTEDCEDIVGVYLQHTKNYILIPSSCKKHTIGYEFILKDKTTGKNAVVQVKQGKVDLDDSLSNAADNVYLFSTEGNITAERPNITTLTSKELFNFVINNYAILPDRIKYWLQFLTSDIAHKAA